MLISLNDFYPVYCLHFFFLIEEITTGKKTHVSLLEHIFMGRQFFGSTLKMLAKEATYFDVLHAIYIEYCITAKCNNAKCNTNCKREKN